MKFAVIGSGFSGSIISNELAKDGHLIDLFESRSHIGGNCFTYQDSETGIIIHKYGPHIFHTDDLHVWKYINKLANFKPFINRVKANVGGRIYSLPINLHTINQFFDECFTPDEAKSFINRLSDLSIANPLSFEEQALKFLGRDLYEAFFKGYTIKQWGLDPKFLPASILKRLPVRFNYDDNYFNHKFQGIPEFGYTPIFEKLINNDNIKLILNTEFDKNLSCEYDHIFYTGPIDSWFNYNFGGLAYRTLDFIKEVHSNDYQGCAVLNYNDESVPFTRITEHKYFTPWNTYDKTIIFKEYSRECLKNDIPYYPIRQVEEKKILNLYLASAKSQEKISFLGRLGTYRYLDMDATIKEALHAVDIVKFNIKNHLDIPPFFIDPS